MPLAPSCQAETAFFRPIHAQGPAEPGSKLRRDVRATAWASVSRAAGAAPLKKRYGTFILGFESVPVTY